MTRNGSSGFFYFSTKQKEMNEMRSAKDRKNAKVAVQQYTTTAAHLDQLGEQARKLRQEMADTTDAVADTREELKGYNERRREQTAELKEILTPIVRHLQAGGTANGVTGLHNWAAWYNPTAKDGKNAARQIMRIVNAPEPGDEEGDIKSPIHLNLDKLTKEMESGRKVMVTSGNFKYELIKTPLLNKTTITLSIADTRPDEVVVKKTTEEMKPVKHAKRPKVGGSWCGKGLTNNNAASQNRYATCPFCIAAMAAGISVDQPDSKRRYLKKELEESRNRLADLEQRVELCLPEYRGKDWESRKAEIPKLAAEIVKLEKRLADWENVKTPEQAVAQAKLDKAAQQAEWDRLAALPKHTFDPADNGLTACGEVIVVGETQMVWGKNTSSATCPACIEVAKQTVPKHSAVNEKQIKVKLTDAQAREVRGLPPFECAGGRHTLPDGCAFEGKNSKTLIFFKTESYPEATKALALALEQSIADYQVEADIVRGKLLDWNDKSKENVANQKLHAKYTGAIKACESAIWAIVHGDDNGEENILDWYEQHRDERLGISEPAKALAETAGGAELTWAQKVCIPDSPERLEWAAGIKQRREFPYVDPNEDDDCEDCLTDEEAL